MSKPYKLASREWKSSDTIIDVAGVRIGAERLVVLAGPCSVESEQQVLETARSVAASGGHILRGGAYKPRTSPYSFQGLGEEGLAYLANARAKTGLPVITEVMGCEDVGLVEEYADILQVGARNMQNFPLLRRVGRARKPVMVKRGFANTIEEWLMAVEYVLAEGNENVMLCERGIRTFETMVRNTFDLTAIPLLKRLTHLPVVADPSHATGKWYLVKPMALAAAAAGADALMIEVHPDPDNAWCDGAESLTLANFADLMPALEAVAGAVGRPMHPTAELV